LAEPVYDDQKEQNTENDTGGVVYDFNVARRNKSKGRPAREGVTVNINNREEEGYEPELDESGEGIVPAEQETRRQSAQKSAGTHPGTAMPQPKKTRRRPNGGLQVIPGGGANEEGAGSTNGGEEPQSDELSPEELENQEKDAEGNPDDQDNPDEEESLFNDEGIRKRRSIRGVFTRKRMGIGAAIAGFIVSAVAAITLQAPNLIINNLKELLLSRIGQVQMHQSRKYRQGKLNRIKNLFKGESRLGQQLLDEMYADGYRPKFDPADKTRLIGLVAPDGTGIIGDGIGDHVDAYLEKKHPFRTARWKTKATNSFDKTFGVSHSSVVDKENPRDGPDGEELDADHVVNREVAKDVLEGDDGTITHNPSTATNEKDKAEQDADSSAYEEEAGKVGTELKQDKDDLIQKGASVDEFTDGGVGKALASAAEGSVDDEILQAVEAQGLGSKLFGKVKSLFNPLDLPSQLCTIRNRIDGMTKLARASRKIKLIRYAMVFVNAADSTRVGKADPKLLSSLMKRVTSEDKNGVSIGGSSGFGYVLKSTFSKSRNNLTRSAVAVDGKPTGVIGGIRGGITNFVGPACPVVSNPIAQGAVAIGSIALAIFTGGGSAEAQAAFEEGFLTGIRQVIEEQISSITVKSIAKDAAIGAAKTISFEAIMGLTEMYIQKSLNLTFTGQEKGGQLGDILSAGMGSANEQRSLQAGMVPATTQEFAAARNEYIAWHDNELKNQSFAQRLFDTGDSDSLMFNLALAVPSSATDVMQRSTDTFSSLTATLLNPGRLLSTLASVNTSKASADDQIPYDSYQLDGGSNSGTQLATDMAGNPQVIMRADIAAIDPETNAQDLITLGQIDPTTLQPVAGSDFEKHIQTCVEAADIYSPIENDEDDCLAHKAITKKFKAHLAYLDMLDGLEAEAFPNEVDTPNVASTVGVDQPGGAISPTDGLTWPLLRNKADTKASLGSCINDAAQSICFAGHPYKAHDLFAPQGTQVVAAAAGTVIKAGVGGCGHGFNKAFTVQVYDQSANTTYFYQHMDPSAGGVKTGTVLKAGDPIGKVGPSSAACNTQTHLHIDAVAGRGRPACSRLSCSAATKAKFLDISKALYKGYAVLP
jgi:hypothetical protein